MPAHPVRRVRREPRALSLAPTRAANRSLAGVFGGAVLAAAAVALLARPAAGDVMTMAPADTEMLVVVPNPQAMSDHIADLTDRLGVPAPGSQNVLGMMMGQLGDPQGVDRERPVAMALSNAAVAMSQQDESLAASLVFVPVNDYGNFVGSLGGASADGVTPLVLADGSEAFVRQAGDYAVVGDNEDAVTAYEPTDRAQQLLTNAGDYTAHLTDQPDLMMVMDMAKLGPAMAEQMAAVNDQIQLGGGMDPGAADAMAANMASMEWFADFAGGAEGALVTANLAGDDVTLGLCAKFADDTPAASIFTGKPASPIASRFAELPDKPFLMAFALDATGIDLAAFTQQFADAMPETAAAQRTMYEASLPMAEQVSGAAGGLYVPAVPAMGLSGLFDVAAVYEVDDADAFVKAFAEYTEQIDGLGMPIPVPGPNGEMTTADMVTRSSYTPDTLSLSGVSLGQWSMDQEMPAELMQQMGPMAGMMQQSYSGYVGGKDDKVFLTTGSDVALLQATIDAQGDGLAGNAPVAKALANDALPDRAMAGYLSLQGIGEMANNFLPMFGMPPIEIPADAAPLGLAMGSSDRQMILEVTLPVESLAIIANEAMQLQAMMGGGMGGPGAGPGSQGGGDGTPRAPQ
ncbi:MAG: hypothetical protein AAGI54_08940 [Planctomycetota bacterium]